MKAKQLIEFSIQEDPITDIVLPIEEKSLYLEVQQLLRQTFGTDHVHGGGGHGYVGLKALIAYVPVGEVQEALSRLPYFSELVIKPHEWIEAFGPRRKSRVVKVES